MANRARRKNYRNHLIQVRNNRINAKYRWKRMRLFANAKKLRSGEINVSDFSKDIKMTINEGEKA